MKIVKTANLDKTIMDKVKRDEFFAIFLAMQKAKHADKKYLYRAFSSLTATFNELNWRVIGITQDALDSFKSVNFERIPNRKDKNPVERAHINKRHDWVEQAFNREWKNSEEWWNFIWENDQTVLATARENKRSDSLGEPLKIAYEIPEGYFASTFIGCKYRKKVEKPLLENFSKM